MQRNYLLATLVAAAFAIPLSVTANTGKTSTDKSATAQTSPSASMDAGNATTTASNDGGAEAMFKAMDKNNDGFISKDEAKGSPHEAEFDKLDTNHDGKLSRAEHANAPDHVAARNKAAGKSASSSDTASDSKTASADTSGAKKY